MSNMWANGMEEKDVQDRGSTILDFYRTEQHLKNYLSQQLKNV